MHTQGNLRSDQMINGERFRQKRMKHPAVPLPMLRAPAFPAAVRAWLLDLPSQLRKARGCYLEDLADLILDEPLNHGEHRTNVLRVVEYVGGVANAHGNGLDRDEFVALILHEPRLVEIGLLFILSQLALTHEIPRDQEFYPAVILDREVLRVIKHMAERDKPAIALLWSLVGVHQRDLVAQIETVASKVERGFAKTTQWPSREVAAQLCSLLQRSCDCWDELARNLIAATEGAGGVLPMFAVEQAAKPYALSRIDRTLLVESINRSRQRQTTLDLLRAARAWPQRASSILENLAGDFGSLRLYGAYLTAIWSDVAALSPEGSEVRQQFNRRGELVERDLAYPISTVTEPPAPVVTLFEEADSYDGVQKKRLSRQRERCLSAELPVMDADFIDTLRELGARHRYVGEPMTDSHVRFVQISPK